ncbi:MAG: type II toxin-antitoxin system PemK/MazF family toxin [Candidatus Micrarchaeia archaeon]
MSNIARAEIWKINLSGSRGHEQKGERPAIIWRDLDHVKMTIVIPFTSKLDRNKLPHTLLVSPDSKNGLEEDSIALIFQITTIDKSQLIKKIGELSDEEIAAITGLLKDMLKI